MVIVHEGCLGDSHSSAARAQVLVRRFKIQLKHVTLLAQANEKRFSGGAAAAAGLMCPAEAAPAAAFAG
jgi:hypothetical protein